MDPIALPTPLKQAFYCLITLAGMAAAVDGAFANRNARAGEPTNPVEFRRVGVTAVWDKYGERLSLGRGQTLALVDDGCKLGMPEWTAKVGDLPKVRVTHDSVDGDSDPSHVGRGYHGSTIGIPSSLNLNGRWGVVPNNQVAVIRALECCHCNVRDSKSLAAGLQWIVENAAKHRITVVNLAPVDDLEHGVPVPTEIDEPLSKLRQLGIWVSAPTGNHQFTKGISWPSCQGDCFAIGAVRPGKDEVFLDRHSKVVLLVPAAATSSSNAIACGAAMILREAIETAKYDWKADGPTLPDAMLAIFQKTGPKVSDPASGLAFPRLDLFAAVEHVFAN
ncbi:MAG: hypothetical protein ACKO38_17645 [Planctomycetota bacterium]